MSDIIKSSDNLQEYSAKNCDDASKSISDKDAQRKNVRNGKDAAVLKRYVQQRFVGMKMRSMESAASYYNFFFFVWEDVQRTVHYIARYVSLSQGTMLLSTHERTRALFG